MLKNLRLNYKHNWMEKMKTPEQMAEEFANRITRESGRFTRHDVGCAFFAGYKAAQDQLADASKVMTDHILGMEKMVDANSSNNSNGWISVKDRLPEPSDSYLLVTQKYREQRQVEYAKFENGSWRASGIGIVTHWMPLPEPPKEEQ